MPRKVQLFRSFSNLNFSLLWLSSVFQSPVMIIERMARSWLVLILTGSPFLMGIANAVQTLPRWFGLVGGIAADRFNRQKILLFSRIVNMVSTLIMAYLVSTEIIHFWHIILITLVTGLAGALTGPSESTFLLDIVGKSNLMNALGLNRITSSIMGILGAFIGGMLIDLVGISSCYYLAAAMRGVSLVVFWMIRIKAKTPVKGEKRNVFRDLVEGLRYIRGSRSLVGLLAIAAYWNLFISMQGFRATLLPIFARDVLGVGASGYGMLSAAANLGTFVGSLLIAVLSNYKHKGWLLLIGAELIGVALILFSLLPHFSFSLFLWACVGIMSSIYSNTSQTLLLTTSSDEMRGRVMGARSQVISVLPINAIWVGVAAQSFGAPLTMILGGSLWGLAVLVTALLVPKLRKIE